MDAQGSCGGSAPSPLQQLDRDAVGRPHERHMPVARRAVDGHARLRQALAGVVDIIDAVGEMAEIAPGWNMLSAAPPSSGGQL
jgi:hypothetical protein